MLTRLPVSSRPPPNLFPIAEETTGNIAIGVPLLAQLVAGPYELFGTAYGAASCFDDLNVSRLVIPLLRSPAQAVREHP